MRLLQRLPFLFLPLLFIMGACNLEKDIEVELPPHTPQLVLECYLEPGKPVRALVTETSGYFDSPELPVVPRANIVITHNNSRQIKLTFSPFQDDSTKKYYTHRSSEVITGKPGDVYTIEVTDEQNRKLTGTTTMMPRVEIDSAEYRYNQKEEAFLLVNFKDDANQRNFYRFTARKRSESNWSTEFTSTDELTNGIPVTYGTAFDFAKGDTAFVSLFHIEEKYYNYLESVSDARRSNGNPFAQPGRIKSTVQGGIGVFTNLAISRKTLILE